MTLRLRVRLDALISLQHNSVMVKECIKCTGVLSVLARIVACSDFFNICMQYDVHSNMPRSQGKDCFKCNFRAMVVLMACYNV